ncbi:DUF1028 domain-containing protein [Oligoflexus tunisiensis]|uniref:DUF1028 domain-containing protein n=1 Tax=Oligoflexus tunisiensis TaxID=708132 RepID=UPI00114D0512|nr:DUF1028 domain-containing protein [Oligoflexus tunisiensis]
MRAPCLRFLISLASLVLSAPAWATYSIVAVDRQTGQVGGAATSCISGASVSRVYQSVPGVGAIHAQAYTNLSGRQYGAELLKQGYAADVIIRALSATDFDPYASYRQYGVVTFDGTSAGFTGTMNGFYANDLQGESGSFLYSIQGNILTSGRVLSQARTGFLATACDLAGRLMAALEAGAEHGEGDSRCRPEAASDAAFLQVDNPDGEIFMRLDVKGSRDPLRELRSRFEVLRRTVGCYQPIP